MGASGIRFTKTTLTGKPSQAVAEALQLLLRRSSRWFSKEMFVFQLMGGAGNQLFQYAAARALSIKRNIPFKVDFDDPYTFVKRSYNLNFFKLSVDFATKKE